MISKLFRYIEEDIPALFLFLMTATILIDVVGRYLLNRPLKGGPEIATLLFVWIVFLSISGSYRKNDHMRINSILSKRFPTLQNIIDLLIDVSILAVSVYTIYISMNLIDVSSSRYMELIGVSYAFVYSAVSLSFGLLVVHSAVKIVSRIKLFLL